MVMVGVGHLAGLIVQHHFLQFVLIRISRDVSYKTVPWIPELQFNFTRLCQTQLNPPTPTAPSRLCPFYFSDSFFFFLLHFDWAVLISRRRVRVWTSVSIAAAAICCPAGNPPCGIHVYSPRHFALCLIMIIITLYGRVSLCCRRQVDRRWERELLWRRY